MFIFPSGYLESTVVPSYMGTYKVSPGSVFLTMNWLATHQYISGEFKTVLQLMANPFGPVLDLAHLKTGVNVSYVANVFFMLKSFIVNFTLRFDG